MATERDYVLGTHDEEIERLGLQHDIWRPVVLDCWKRAGITTGKRVLDIGAGPGYATLDLAKIVGPTGAVTAVERSSKFVSTIKERCRAASVNNVTIHELDLMTDELPRGDYDFSWCRWVLCFVSDPGLLIRKLAAVMPKGGKSIFHEYAHYETWRFVPLTERQERFRQHVVETWRESGGEPDAAMLLPPLLEQNGFVVRSATPHIFAIRPNDYMWQWPATFIDGYLPSLEKTGRIDRAFSDAFRSELRAAAKNPNTLMITPLVLEIVAERV